MVTDLFVINFKFITLAVPDKKSLDRRTQQSDRARGQFFPVRNPKIIRV